MHAFLAGLLFAVGLGLAGMTNPDTVQGFFDVFGTWNPQLALVMVGAIAVNLVAFPKILGRSRRAKAHVQGLPSQSRIDRRLVVGSALFGLGWGAVGVCPGPAIVSVGGGTTLAFVGAMMVGMWVHRRFFEGALS